MSDKTTSYKTRVNRNRANYLVRTAEILEGIGDGFFALDHDWRLVYINATAASILGFKPQDLIGQNLWEKLPQIIGTEHEVNYRKAMSEGQPQEFEWYSVLTHKWYNIRVSPSKEGISVYWQDFTERKKAEESLRESEQLHRAIFTNSIDGVVISSGTGIIYAANEAALGMFGVTEEEFKRRGRDFVLDKSDPRLKPALEERARTGQFIGEINFKRKDGTVFPSEVSSSMFTGQGGQPRAVLIIRDITRRKQVEAKLARAKNELEIKVKERTHELTQSEKRYRLLVDNANEVVAVAQDGLVKFMNKKGLEMTGYSLEDVVGKPFLEFVHSNDRKAAEEHARKRIEGEPVPSAYEVRVVPKDGSIRWAQMNGAKILWEGKPAILAIFMDITERKQAEEKLREREESFRSIYEDSPIGIELYDARGELIRANEACLKIFGVSEVSQVKGFRLFDDPNITPEIKERIRKGEPAEFEAQFDFEKVKELGLYETSKSGFAYLDVILTPLKQGKKDALHGYLVQVQDITDRKGVEEALRESEAKANALIKYAPTAIFEIDFRGPCFISVNDAMSSISGYSREELLALNPLEFLDDDSRKFFAERIKRKLAGEDIEETVDYKVKKKDGSFLYLTLQITTSEKDPNIVFAIGHDITERKIMEQALQNYARRITEVQEEERKRIAYELHDDTAQYLSILKMQLDALLHSGKIQSPEVTEKLQYLEKDADRAFQDVRRYSHELRPVTLESMGLLAALEQVVDDYNKLGQLPIEIKVGGEEPELPEEVKLGFFRIAQEALNNIRKHAKASLATITLTFQETRVELLVRDNGTGFDKKEAASRASGKGSLGLMSMKERADFIGASLKIESKPGQGTIVKVEWRSSFPGSNSQ